VVLFVCLTCTVVAALYLPGRSPEHIRVFFWRPVSVSAFSCIRPPVRGLQRRTSKNSCSCSWSSID
jgi:hypothetical protein